MDELFSCVGARACPISLEPCPGDCVFADVMQSSRHGILVLDAGAEKLFFANRGAREILSEIAVAVEYSAIITAFFGARIDPGLLDTQSSHSCRFGERLIGFTAYTSGRFHWMFLRDITDQVRIETIAEAMEISNSFAHVFAAVRHEIGNPVNSVKMALSVLRRHFDRFPREAVLDYLDRSLADLGRVEELLASLRNLSFYDDLRLSPVELDEWLTEFVGAAATDLKERGIALELVPDFEGGRILVDPRAMRQVLANLVANAADAVTGRPAPQIRIETGRRDTLVEVRVVDNGTGMRLETLGKIFKPFFTTKSNGTGLGLLIVRKLLARMDGLVELASVEGQGTTVHLTFPEVRG